MTSLTPLPPVRRSRELGVSAERAFEAVTDEIGSWWPLARFSCSEDATATLAFVDGQLVETGPDGTRYVWGTVQRWEPPREVAFSWHPGRGAAPGEPVGDVELRVTPLGPDRCLVEVVHRGWERFAPDVAAAAHEEYGNGWPGVLAGLAALVEAEERPQTWFVLAHSPGARWQHDRGITEQDGMGAHLAFVEELAAAGLLVAAGPLPESPGQGRTVIRGVDRDEAVRLATAVDQAVVTGLLTVDVSPWLVVTEARSAG